MTSSGQEQSLKVQNLCSVIREAEFDSVSKKIAGSYARLDDLDNAIDWALSRFTRKMDEFYLLGEDKYLWKTEKVLGFPKLRILFRFDEAANTIYLVSLEEIIEE